MTSIYQPSITRIPSFRDISDQSYTTEDTQSQILVRLETLTNQTGSLRSDVQDRSIKFNTQIRDLGDERLKLTEPILITIEEFPGEEEIIASFPEVEVFGEGTTEAEAILNLKWAILDLYQDLLDTAPEELGSLPRSWLKILQQIIK